jgi:hypothetical protein
MPREAAVRQPQCADSGGFSLHAAVRIEAHDRRRLERLSRYIARPALSDERIRVNAAGKAATGAARTAAPWELKIIAATLERAAIEKTLTQLGWTPGRHPGDRRARRASRATRSPQTEQRAPSGGTARFRCRHERAPSSDSHADSRTDRRDAHALRRTPCHTGQRRVRARSHVQRLDRYPNRVDPDHLINSLSQAPHSTDTFIGQLTFTCIGPRLISTTMAGGWTSS